MSRFKMTVISPYLLFALLVSCKTHAMDQKYKTHVRIEQEEEAAFSYTSPQPQRSQAQADQQAHTIFPRLAGGRTARDADSGVGLGLGGTQASSEPVVNTEEIPKEIADSVLAICPVKITELIALLNSKTASDANRPRKCLLVGAPGTGKSTIGKAIAQRMGAPFFMYDASTIGDEYQSSGAKNIERIFLKAASLNKPCVVIIDEVARLFMLSEHHRTNESGVLDRLITLIENPQFKDILLIGTTNSTDKIPKTFVNRFGKWIVDFPLPSERHRKIIIAALMARQKDFKLNDTLAHNLAQLSGSLSARNIENIILDAVNKASLRTDATSATPVPPAMAST